ncbi:vacuolar protein sorting-associated protein 53 A-like isoform X4 [Olea europaea var. sylvestris]|uniref:vacuolar protein sorting-associated protein 53 A-like isoform X4 n=1 Tax=Olea europaea var. sylvestris TaxID=158386 RepID=UPI000C1D5909|nr:vacuolar protein sorting-associated protein 53 A-like isoform X4 [Olea europaea var. sylvestris]
MLAVSAVEQLQVMASKRQYKEAAAQLEAVNQLCSHFEAYRDIPKITELREKFKSIKQILKSHVFSDFSSLGSGKEMEENNLLQQLSDACLVVDALEPSVREDLVKNFCSRELTSYQQIFEGAELAKLDKTERRYAWIKRRLRTNEEIWKIFPPSWHVPYLLCIQFCKLTRTQLVEILNDLKEKPDVGTLLMALQRTLEFEEELAEKFGGGSQNRLTGNDSGELHEGESTSHAISDIRKKYEKKLAAHHGSGNEEHDQHRDLTLPGAGFNFHGIISSCFEPHLTVYVELEEKTLMDNLEKLVQEETWETEEGSQTNILSSSAQAGRRKTSHIDKALQIPLLQRSQVFSIIRRSLKRCSALTKNQTLFNLFKVFQRFLKAYATKLFMRLPKGGAGIVAAATGMDGQIKSGELAENVSKIIEPQFVDMIDMSEVQDEFSAVITKALITLVNGIETKFDAEMAAMTRVPWGTLESVGDQSEYVNSINMIFTTSIPVLGSLLSPIYFQFFLDKLASSLGPRFYLNIFKCKQISETGAQQMLLDTQAVKTILLDIPSLGKQTSGASSYSKFVNREMSKAEALLKVILSPVDSVADTYCALLPEGTAAEFQRILDLKGLKRTDQQSILDDYNKRGARTTQPSFNSVMPAVSSTSIAPVLSSPAAPGIILSGEEVLARAAAFGRGFSATGFKKFLALTEAAKDQKDGTLRKFFVG